MTGPATRINSRRRRRRGAAAPSIFGRDSDITFVPVGDFVHAPPMVYRLARPDHHRRTLAKLGPVARKRQGTRKRPGDTRDDIEPATGIG